MGLPLKLERYTRTDAARRRSTLRMSPTSSSASLTANPKLTWQPCGASCSPSLRAGETYCMPRDVSQLDALDYWSGRPHRTFVATTGEGEIVGTYFLTPNQRGGGAHVCNCGFASTIRGVGTALLQHALTEARAVQAFEPCSSIL